MKYFEMSLTLSLGVFFLLTIVILSLNAGERIKSCLVLIAYILCAIMWVAILIFYFIGGYMV